MGNMQESEKRDKLERNGVKHGCIFTSFCLLTFLTSFCRVNNFNFLLTYGPKVLGGD